MSDKIYEKKRKLIFGGLFSFSKDWLACLFVCCFIYLTKNGQLEVVDIIVLIKPLQGQLLLTYYKNMLQQCI